MMKYDAFNLKILINDIEVKNYCLNNIKINKESNILDLILNSWTFRDIWKTLEETVNSMISILTLENEIIYQGKIKKYSIKRNFFSGYSVSLKSF